MKDIPTAEAVQTLKDFAMYGRYYSNNTEHHMKSSINRVLNELEKKDKIIDAMAEWIGDRCFYSDDYGNSCEIIQDSCYDPVQDCKNCIKQYFEQEVKDE